MIWFISDHHWFHKNIIQYCNRPFSSVEEMNEEMITRWNEKIKPEDTVYYLGDFAFCHRNIMKDILSRLNGYKILIKGNHDQNNAVMIEAGFNEVYSFKTIDLAGENVILCHYPYKPKDVEITKMFRKYPEDKGKWLIHGHVHQHWKTKGRMINVSADVWDFYPVSSAEIESIIFNSKKQI